MYCHLHSVPFQVSITFSLDQRGEDILKAVNVYQKTPWENQSNGKIMLFTSHQGLFGWLCDYEWMVGCASTFFFWVRVCSFVITGDPESNMTWVQISCLPNTTPRMHWWIHNQLRRYIKLMLQTVNVVFVLNSMRFLSLLKLNTECSLEITPWNDQEQNLFTCWVWFYP